LADDGVAQRELARVQDLARKGPQEFNLMLSTRRDVCDASIAADCQDNVAVS
jgi:hypothetical protein